MKRSEINQLIRNSIDFFNQMNFKLPPWAFWKPEDWKSNYENCHEIVDNMLGWDLTDFGSGKFNECGLILFTLRNGNPKKDKKIYAEKAMIVEELQETPMHFHWSKMEDIINRGGGNLVIELYNSDENEEFTKEDLVLKVGGLRRTIKPGGIFKLSPNDNRCYNPVGRFPEITEYEESLHLLSSDYKNYLRTNFPNV